MKSFLGSLERHPELLFFMFALLIGMRDVGFELIFVSKDKEDAACVAACFAFLVCATITTLSLSIIIYNKGLQELIEKILNRRILLRIIIVGASAAIVYLVTFEFIRHVGAGVFNLFDYGLAPILTGMLGFIIFSNPLTVRFWIAIAFYVVGILLLFWQNENTGGLWIIIAILSPVCTAISDATTKWLLSDEGGKLNRSELLFVRFLPATLLIAIWDFSIGDGIHLHEGVYSIPLAVFCGFLPLWLLCTALGKAALTKFAVWEFLIPAVAFFGTLPLHPEHRQLMPITGAVIIMLTVALHEIKWSPKDEKPKELEE